MSLTGMPSVMQTTRSRPLSTASRMASAANGGGTKIAEAVAPVCFTASATVSKIGTLFSKVCPPLPGVTPATTGVPYARLSCVCRAPNAPVTPWTRIFVPGLTRMDMRDTHSFYHLFRRLGHRTAAEDGQAGIGERLFAGFDVVAFEADHQGQFE